MKISHLKTIILLSIATIAMAFSIHNNPFQQESEPWSESQLMEPVKLAQMLNDPSEQGNQLILAVNPDGMYGLPYEGGIKEARWFGPTEKEKYLKDLKEFLQQLDQDENIVIYCGCCPFDKCPNIRPAFSLLNSMGFTKHKLLNMPKNIKENWIDKGYPMKE